MQAGGHPGFRKAGVAFPKLSAELSAAVSPPAGRVLGAAVPFVSGRLERFGFVTPRDLDADAALKFVRGPVRNLLAAVHGLSFGTQRASPICDPQDRPACLTPPPARGEPSTRALSPR